MKIKIPIGSGSVLLCLSSPKHAAIFLSLDILFISAVLDRVLKSIALLVTCYFSELYRNQHYKLAVLVQVIGNHT